MFSVWYCSYNTFFLLCGLAPLEIVQIFWLQLEILHSEQILSKKFDKRLQFRYRSVNFVSMYSNIRLQLSKPVTKPVCICIYSDRPANIVNS